MSNTILLALVPVFFVMALGYGAGKLRIIDNAQIGGLNALVMDFALPASLLAATASASRRQLLAQIPLAAALGAVMVVIYLVWFLLLRGSSQSSRADASLQALTIAFPNLAGVGLPIASAVFGPAGTVPVASALAAGSILVVPLSLVLLEINRAGDGIVTQGRLTQIRVALRRALAKPVVVAPAIGILVSLCDWKLDAVAQMCLSLIGHAAAGVALFLTGLVLSAQVFRLNWKIVAATGMADVIRPGLATAVAATLRLPPDVAKVAILLGAMPSGFFGILFAVNYRLDSTCAGSIVIASTLCSIVTLALAMSFIVSR